MIHGIKFTTRGKTVSHTVATHLKFGAKFDEWLTRWRGHFENEEFTRVIDHGDGAFTIVFDDVERSITTRPIF